MTGLLDMRLIRRGVELCLQRGQFESDVRFYFHGAADMALMRHKFKIYDDNMFATSWVMSCLLEAYKYGNAPRPAQEQIEWTMEVIGNYHDKNRNFSNSLMTLWPEVYNSTVKTWQSSPQFPVGKTCSEVTFKDRFEPNLIQSFRILRGMT
jgi:hypothetical protein